MPAFCAGDVDEEEFHYKNALLQPLAPYLSPDSQHLPCSHFSALTQEAANFASANNRSVYTGPIGSMDLNMILYPASTDKTHVPAGLGELGLHTSTVIVRHGN